MTRTVSLKVAQFKISFDIKANHKQIMSMLDEVAEDEVIVFPEGALSGYSPDNTFLSRIDESLLQSCINNFREEAVLRGVHLILGSCIREGGSWFNAGMYFGPNREYVLYKKINLANSERGCFSSGNELSTFDIQLKQFKFKAAFQLCREIRYPEQWQALANEGAELFFYLTNAVGDIEIAPVWRSHLVSRAAENQRFICGANAADAEQKCPSIIISPAGKVLCEELSGNASVILANIDLDEVSDWNLDQRRKDVVEVVLK
jgi:predicted amidohydrolase